MKKTMDAVILPHRLLLIVTICSSLVVDASFVSTSMSCGAGDMDMSMGNLIPMRREVHGDGRILDITHRYTKDMPFWLSSNGIGQFLWLPNSMKNGSITNNSEMKLPTHTGTHVDAPGHIFDNYFDAGFDVDTLDLAILNGM